MPKTKFFTTMHYTSIIKAIWMYQEFGVQFYIEHRTTGYVGCLPEIFTFKDEIFTDHTAESEMSFFVKPESYKFFEPRVDDLYYSEQNEKYREIEKICTRLEDSSGDRVEALSLYPVLAMTEEEQEAVLNEMYMIYPKDHDEGDWDSPEAIRIIKRDGKEFFLPTIEEVA